MLISFDGLKCPVVISYPVPDPLSQSSKLLERQCSKKKPSTAGMGLCNNLRVCVLLCMAILSQKGNARLYSID